MQTLKTKFQRQRPTRRSHSGKVGNRSAPQLFTGTYREHRCCLQGKETSMSRTTSLRESAPPRPLHERHRPEKTLLYRIIDSHYLEFLSYMEELGKPLPYHVQKEFDGYLKCGRLESVGIEGRFFGKDTKFSNMQWRQRDRYLCERLSSTI